jgi:hypothetical protein
LSIGGGKKLTESGINGTFTHNFSVSRGFYLWDTCATFDFSDDPQWEMDLFGSNKFEACKFVSNK